MAATALVSISAAQPAAAQRIDDIVAFGDSYADTGNAIEMLLASPFVPQATKDQLMLVYPTGRFSGGTNYIDTLSQLLNADVDNFAIGGALTDDVNTNGPILPGFETQWEAFLAGNTLGGVFPSSDGTFDEDDLLAISVGGNDARFFERSGGLLEDAADEGIASAASAQLGLDALVAAGAQNISFLTGDTSLLPEVALDPDAQAIRRAYSTAFNAQMQSVLAGYAANGAIVHYLDGTLVLQQVAANPGAYGLTSASFCDPAPACIGDPNFRDQFLFYVDALHLTPAGFAIVAQYIATQLQAPLTLQAPSDLGLDTARQFGRTLSSRIDLGAPRDGGFAEGINFFVVGDTFSRDVVADSATDAFDIDGVGVTAGASYGFGTGTIGIAGNYSKPKAKFGADVAETETTSWQVGAFGGFAIAGAFAQGYLGYGEDDHDIRRAGVVDPMRASPNGNHWLAGAKAGYLLPVGIMRAGPVVALDYAKAKVDAYTESGDPALTLNVDSVSSRSLTTGVGAELRGDFEGGGVQLRPFATAMLEGDLLGDGRTVRFAQTSAPGIVNSWHLEDRSKDIYGRVAVGGSAAILGGVNLDALASTTLGREDGNEVSAHVGLRIGL